MPLSPSFAVSQSAQTPSDVTLTDDSTGSDAAIASRRAYISDSNGNYLVPSGVSTQYNAWPLASTSITLDILTEDKAVSILIQWLDASNVVLYSSTEQYCLAEYNKQFHYSLIQQQALNPGITQDASYFSNLATFWTSLIGAIKAVETGDDIAASQNCLNRCTLMQNNESFYF
jgi:hypothetical protein